MREGRYDNVTFSAAQQLMNTSTAPQALSRSFAQAIVNMIPTKGGTLAIRNGTVALGSPTGDGNIIETMPYVKADGTEQTLVYTDNGKIKLFDESLNTYTDVETGLDTDGVPFYTHFNQGGVPYLVIVNGIDPNMIWDGSTITNMAEFVEDLGASKTWVSATQLNLNTGTLGATNYPNGRRVRITFSTTSHLNVSSITRVGSVATVTTTVANNLVTGDYVTIAGAHQPEYNGTFQITSTGASTFTYTVAGTPATPATSSITCVLSGIQRTTTVSSTSLSGQVLTVTIASPLMPAASVTITKFEFETAPEPFSFIFAAQGRLWGLPGGKMKANEFRNNTKRGYIYYTTSIDVINSWFAPSTMAQAFFDASNKMPTADEVIAIAEYQEFMVFFGRKHFQVYQGTNPSSATEWQYARTLPLGLVQAKLLVRLPNDLGFMSPYGVRTLRLAITNENVEASDAIGSSIDHTVIEEVVELKASDAAYRKARSFFYPKQGVFGFKVPRKTMVLKISEEARGWVEWTGDFAEADSFSSSVKDRLLLSDGEQLLLYADGNTSTTLAYADRGQPISWVWWTPWVGGTRRWANHAFEVIHNDSVQLSFEVVRLKNNSLGFQSSNTLTTSQSLGFWDESFWDTTFWDATETVIPKIRDKFEAQTMSFVVRGQTTVGPFEVVSLMCFGQWER